MASLYDVLRVDPTATLDEIKVAFKRRALQVHPDKGGTEEAFHLVYQALETLANPASRKRYDSQQAGGSNPRHAQRNGPAPRKATKKAPKKAKDPKTKPTATGGTQPKATSTAEDSTPTSRQTKLLVKLRDLLKQLPRDVRNDVFLHQFSQKQRLILENWMGEQLDQKPPKPAVLRGDESPKNQDRGRKHDSICLPGHEERPGAVNSMVRWSGVKAPRKKRKTDSHKVTRARAHGTVKSVGSAGRYRANIVFDGLEVYTSCTDFQTALDHLMVLTFVRQKMQDLTNKTASFEERFRQTLASCATAQGLDIADLNPSFCVLQICNFFLGRGLKLRTPMVKNIEQLGKMRRCLEPFRQYSRCIGTKTWLYSLYSPAHLANAWEKLQDALADAWKIARSDSTEFLQKMRVSYEATASSRFRALQHWERQKMVAHDKNQYRPRRLKERSSFQIELRERQKMAAHDKNNYRPRRLRERSSRQLEMRERRSMAAHDKNQHRPRRLRDPAYVSQQLMSRRLLALKLLLVRWERMLTCQQKQDHAQRRRLEVSRRKRMREEERSKKQERSKKETQKCKRRKFSGFMEDLQWI
eukprot:Skav231736  [mRNA]  locus=scaffold638:142260:144011:- [translate_table: standard]